MRTIKLVLMGVLLMAMGSCKKGDKAPYDPGKQWVVRSFAGNGPFYSDGPGKSAGFNYPSSMVIDNADNLFVYDGFNNSIRKVTPDGVVSTFAGTVGVGGYMDGQGPNAAFAEGRNSVMEIDPQNNIYVADIGNNCIRKITPAGLVTTYAGKAGVPGSDDGPAADARFSFAGNKADGAIAADAFGNVYVADQKGIRKISPDGIVSTLVKKLGNKNRFGPVASASVAAICRDMVTDKAGNLYALNQTGIQYEWAYSVIKISVDGMMTLLAGGNPDQGYSNGGAVGAQFRSAMWGMGIDKDGNIYLADSENHVVRKITVTGAFPVVSTFAGVQYSRETPGKPDVQTINSKPGVALTEAYFEWVQDIVVDSKGSVFVLDWLDHKISKVSLDPKPDLRTPAEKAKANWYEPGGWQ